MTGLLQDLRHAVRLYKRIGFTAIAILTIGVGVAATTTIFSVIEGTVLRPWPFPGSERLVMLQSTRPARGQSWNSVTYADYEDWKAASVFERIAAYRTRSADLAGGTYITPTDFEVSNQNWQVTIRNQLDIAVFGPAGEGIQPVSGVGSDEAFKLGVDPGPVRPPAPSASTWWMPASTRPAAASRCRWS